MEKNIRRGLARLAAVVAFVALAAPLAVGCGGDEEEGGADCGSSSRAVDPGSLAYSEACCADVECATGTCADFSKKGQRCSKPCASDADCAGLGEGRCGGQGVCAVPD